jgi:hypothetical protein
MEKNSIKEVTPLPHHVPKPSGLKGGEEGIILWIKKI